MSTLAGSYQSAGDFRRATFMAGTSVDELDALYPGYLDIRLVMRSGEISSRLIKRYAVPLDMTEPPATVLRWLVDLVTFDAFMKLGFNGTNDEEITEAKDLALAQLREAADAENGLYELPLREGDKDGAVTKGGPMAYAEASPYDAKYLQRRAVAYGRGGRLR